ncbi:MAG: serine/threonine-protein kinase [Planctomycetaceae bacterium]|nr:serine/threonine-protein kinase [Planctomycetaceae bacterium]
MTRHSGDAASDCTTEIVDQIATEFAAARIHGRQVTVESVLHANTGMNRPVLLRELLLEEFELRSCTGALLSIAEWESRFPADVTTVREAWSFFHESKVPTAVTKLLGASVADRARPDAASFSIAVGPDVSAAAVAPQQAVGRYRLHERLGQGGMGIVYRAFDPVTQRDVAVKVIHTPALSSEMVRTRFEREARLVGGLSHPLIIPVLDAQLDRDPAYFAMPLIDGRTLKQMVSLRLLAADEAASLISRLASAVQYAHENGVIHRDLKPANVMLEWQDDRPWLLDFGLAVRVETSDQLTQPGMVVGTPQFMAPEQAIGLETATVLAEKAGRVAQVDKRADIYGLGALLYFCLTGHPPHQGASPVDVLRRVIDEEPESVDSAQSVPADLITICQKAMCRNREGRYQTANGLRADLQRFLRDEPILARRTPMWRRIRKWGRRNRWAARFLTTMLFAVCMSGVAAIQFRQRAGLEQRARETAERVQQQLRQQVQRAQEASMASRVSTAALAHGFGDFAEYSDVRSQLNAELNSRPALAEMVNAVLPMQGHRRLIPTCQLVDGQWEFSDADYQAVSGRLVTLDGGSLVSIFDVRARRHVRRLTRGLERERHATGESGPCSHMLHFSYLAENDSNPVESTVYTTVCWLGNKDQVLVTVDDGRCLVFDANRPVGDKSQPVREFVRYPAAVSVSRCHTDRHHVLLGAQDGRLSVLTTAGDQVASTQLSGPVTAAESFPGGWLIGTQAGELLAFDGELRPLGAVRVGAAVWSIAVHDGQIAVGAEDEVVRTYRLAKDLILESESVYQTTIRLGNGAHAYVCVQYQGEELWAFDDFGRACRVIPSLQKCVRTGYVCRFIRDRRTRPVRSPRYRRVVFAEPVGKELLIADMSGTIRSFRVEQSVVERPFEEIDLPQLDAGRLSAAPDEELIWLVDRTGMLVAMTPERCLASVRLAQSESIATLPTGSPTAQERYSLRVDVAALRDRRAAVVTGGRKVEIWEIDSTGQLSCGPTLASERPLISVAVSEAHDLVAATDDCSRVNVWELNSGRRLRVVPLNPDQQHPPPPQEPLTGDLAFSPDGQYLVAFGTGQSSRILRTDNWRPLPRSVEVSGQGGIDVEWSADQSMIFRADSRTTGITTFRDQLASSGAALSWQPCTLAVHREFAVVASAVGQLTVLSPSTGQKLVTTTVGMRQVCDVEITSAGRVVLANRAGHVIVSRRMEPANSRLGGWEVPAADVDVQDVLAEDRQLESIGDFHLTGHVQEPVNHRASPAAELHGPDSEAELFLAVPVRAAGDAYGKLMTARWNRGHWVTETTFDDPSRSVFPARIGVSRNGESLAFRVVTDAANYVGDLLLLQKTNGRWREELVHTGGNRGLFPLFYDSEKGMSIFHHDAEFRDVVASFQAGATVSGWPTRRLAALTGCGLRGVCYQGRVVLQSGRYRISRDNTTQLLLTDGETVESLPVPDGSFVSQTQLTPGGELTCLANPYDGSPSSIQRLHEGVWTPVCTFPFDGAVLSRYQILENGMIVTSHGVGERLCLLVFQGGRWNQVKWPVGGRLAGGMVRDFAVTSDGFVTLLVSSSDVPRWLRSVRFPVSYLSQESGTP